METEVIVRLLLIYIHLMLCVFALHDVLVNDWKVLRRQLRPDELATLHRRVVWLLSGLWLTGLAVAAIDLGFDPTQLADAPKTVAKLATVGVLSVNGLLLRYWCFPRIWRIEELGAAEVALVTAAGAMSTASWLMASFLGVARPLRDAPGLLHLYGAVLAAAVVVAVALSPLLRRRLALISANGWVER